MFGYCQPSRGGIDADWAVRARGWLALRVVFECRPNEDAAYRGKGSRMNAPQHTPLVLVVDDEPHIRHVLENRLLDAGYRVETACDGEEAYDLACRMRPDVLITDERMPFLSGVELCLKLRQTRETAGLPVIMLTARRFADACIDREGTNIAAVLSKPFSPREMLSRVQDLSGSRSLLAQHA